MRITWKELTVSLAGVDVDDLFSEWRWLVGREYQPIVLSSLGDLFLQHADGRVFWLSTAWGQLMEVAATHEEFQARMVQRDNADLWFMPTLVGDILTSGKSLGPNECFSFQVPPVLGGQVEPENFEPTDLSVHFSILGQVHRQIKDLPPGTPIGKIRIE